MAAAIAVVSSSSDSVSESCEGRAEGKKKVTGEREGGEGEGVIGREWRGE